MTKQRNLQTILCLIGVAVVAGGCAEQYKKQEEAAKKMPVDCATAEGDIRTLRSEKANAAQQMAMGVTGIAPIGLVAGLVTRTEGTKYQVATGEYNKALDTKIAEIQTTCGVK
jgi:hypothetical protein